MDALHGIIPVSGLAWITAAVTVCAAGAAVLPAPGENSGRAYRAAYRLIQWVALNLGKARNAQDMQKTIPDDGKR